MNRAIEILFEDNHLLVVNKPPGLATMGTGDSHSLHGWACRYIRQRYDKPGKVFLGVVHRLDAMTSGTLVLARTSKSAARLSEQFRKRSEGPEKIYLAVVAGQLAAPQGTLRDRLSKDEAHHRMRVVQSRPAGAGDDGGDGAEGGEGEQAVLDYRVLRQHRGGQRGGGQRGGGQRGGGQRGSQPSGYCLVAVRLRTGRKHQIRVQFADRGHVVWGDAKYGDRRNRLTSGGEAGIALHAMSLSIAHPTGRQRISFRCRPPSDWGEFLPTPAEWEAALAPWDDATGTR